ncbi:DNA polymerase III subunit epsilon [Rhodoferax lacus]|uniref:DNA-directed DNA polymerase n=1 Tax=Rhodoferax lacus TaxID=2184758 RepID=A0A3E1RH71_9BURK|nr:exonuclease domain-containing protein [Rhodoferax lacus]RFO98727.1 DNA polymerase III subunit epsilon [Rhodoferax lacus]
MLPCYVMLDLETTGGNAVHDRITEIAAVRVENGVETARWSTLVNPGVRIPPFIQSLTGISDAMVADAPPFEDVARTLLELLDGAVFVAHNVRFDHGFVQNELARMELPLKVKTLCTVRLSRKLYPQHKGHGLDAILQRHGLHTMARHRAMGDVDVVLQWLKIAADELGHDALQRSAQELLQGSAAVPPQLETAISDIPDTPGVYLFYGEGPLPLYIGKSVNIRTRVMSHFQSAAKVAREMRILTEIRRVEWIETAGELGALLLESRLVKQRQPVYNRQLRREKALCSWQLNADPAANPLVKLVQMDDIEPMQWQQLYGTYRSKRQALDALRALCDTHGLCPQLLGLESGKGACFACQTGRCKGACAGREPKPMHRVRLQLALGLQRLQAWPHKGRVAIREYQAQTGRTDIHVFDQWCHLATVSDLSELEDANQTQHDGLAFDLDTYRLLHKRLGSAGVRDAEVFFLAVTDPESMDSEGS